MIKRRFWNKKLAPLALATLMVVSVCVGSITTTQKAAAQDNAWSVTKVDSVGSHILDPSIAVDANGHPHIGHSAQSEGEK